MGMGIFWMGKGLKVVIPVDQTQFGKPEGNCTQACIASMLELPIEAVPPAWVGDGTGFNEYKECFTELNRLLKPFGYAVIDINLEVAGSCLAMAPETLCFLSGRSPRATKDDETFLHLVVGKLNSELEWEIVHDPHPSRDGLVNIQSVGFLVKV